MNWTRVFTISCLLIGLLGSSWHYQQTNPAGGLLGFFPFFYLEISSELVSLSIIILVIDYLNEQREVRRLQRQLIYELGSRHNHTAGRAAYELRERGWLMDGSLENANLFQADLTGVNLANADLCHANLQEVLLINAELQNANLSETDLRGANLTGANLQNANLRDSNVTPEQLAQAKSTEGAVLPQKEPL